MNKSSLKLATGVFLGNWLVVPLFFQGRTFMDGFFNGLITIPIVLVLCKFFGNK